MQFGKEEVIIARKETEISPEEREDAKSYYYPPDEDEPQEIRDMEEKFQQAVEMKRKHFGTPVFRRQPCMRGIGADTPDDDWDMMAQATPLDTTHMVDSDDVDALLMKIMEDPPILQRIHNGYPNETIVVENGEVR